MRFIFFVLLVFATYLNVCAQNDISKIDASVNERGRLYFESSDKKYSWWFDSRIYLDGAYFHNYADENLTSSGNDFMFSNGINPRRIRFAVKATLDKKWFSELDMDFAYNELEIKDLYAGYRINKNLFVKAGHFKEPMSMDRTTSSRYLSFMERPNVIEAFAAGRSLGVSLTGFNRFLWASGGVFGQKIDADQKSTNRGNDGMAATARIAIFPINKTNHTLHIGGYATYRTPDAIGASDRKVQFRTFPESRVDRRRFVNATINNTAYFTVSGVELAYRYNRFLIEGEYLVTNVSRYKYTAQNTKENLKNAVFDGYYISGSYCILGSAREYSNSEAEFSTGLVNGKKGNLDLALRYAYMNMNDFHESNRTYWITGGKSGIWTAAINYIPIRNIQLSLSYSMVNHDKWADAAGTILYNGLPLNQGLKNGLDFNILQCRLMAMF